MNREQRRRSFKKNKKSLGLSWDEFNATFIKEKPIRKDLTTK